MPPRPQDSGPGSGQEPREHVAHLPSRPARGGRWVPSLPRPSRRSTGEPAAQGAVCQSGTAPGSEAEPG